MRDRIREWWERVSTSELEGSATRRRAERTRLLDAIDLTTADRVAAALMRGEPAIDHAEAPFPADDIDAYTRAFLRRNGGRAHRAGGLSLRHEADLEPMNAGGGIVEQLVAYRDDEPLVVLAGNRCVWWCGPLRVCAASIAHCVLDTQLSNDELAALVTDPVGWAPDVDQHPTPIALPTRPRPLTLNLQSQTLALARTPVALAFMAVALSVVFAPLQPGPWMVCALIVAGPLAYFSVARCIEVFWLEPRARRLAIDDAGLTHPRTGKRIVWESVHAIERRWLGFALTLPDQVVVRIPRRLFVDGHRAEAHLRGRIAKLDAGPYRH